MSHRENLFFRFTVASEGVVKLINQSVNDPNFPSEENRVRCVIGIAGFLLESIDDGKRTRLSRLLQLDPKGSVPTMVVNMNVAKVGDSIVKARAYLGAK